MSMRQLLAFDLDTRYAEAMLKLTPLFVLVVVLLAMGLFAGCGGPQTRVIGAHTMSFDGEKEDARLSVDGVPVRVVYDRVTGAYRAPGCDFGPAATLESLAEQVATTSPTTCEPLDGTSE